MAQGGSPLALHDNQHYARHYHHRPRHKIAANGNVGEKGTEQYTPESIGHIQSHCPAYAGYIHGRVPASV